jgi:hypothetical protein
MAALTHWICADSHSTCMVAPEGFSPVLCQKFPFHIPLHFNLKNAGILAVLQGCSRGQMKLVLSHRSIALVPGLAPFL